MAELIEHHHHTLQISVERRQGGWGGVREGGREGERELERERERERKLERDGGRLTGS